jgi:peptidoglycan/xylan/chitin deacetylase (PgdA/CDA1 family)
MILLYHAIVSDAAPEGRYCIGQALPRRSFERQIRWLKNYGEVLPLPEYLELTTENRTTKFAITFDDGMACTFEHGCPVLRELNCPATFFVSTAHLDRGEPLWFNYLNALCFEGIYDSIAVNRTTVPLQTVQQKKSARINLEQKARASGRPDNFCRQLASNFPLPRELADQYSGMSQAEIQELCSCKLFEIGAHTVHHPFLTRIPISLQIEEICRSKQQLSQFSRRPIRYFSYPGGDYNSETIELVKAAGFEASFATIPRGIGAEGPFEIGRVGIYSSSLLKFSLKARGVATLLQRVGIRIG